MFEVLFITMLKYCNIRSIALRLLPEIQTSYAVCLSICILVYTFDYTWILYTRLNITLKQTFNQCANSGRNSAIQTESRFKRIMRFL